MVALLICLSRAGLLLLGALYLSPPAVPPVAVSVRIVSGPWGGREYSIAHGTLTVFNIPAIQATSRTPQRVFSTPLPADAANRRFNALDPNAYQGLPNEMLDGGSMLMVTLQQGGSRADVRYQHGQYNHLDPITAFLLAYINQHVPAKLAIDADWLKPVARASR